MKILVSFLNNLLPSDLNPYFVIFLHVLILLHVLAFLCYAGLLVKSFLKTNDKITLTY